MANTISSVNEIGILLSRCRKESYNRALTTQKALAIELGIDKKKMSDIENGYHIPRLELMAKWCTVTGHHEAWESIKFFYKLEPLATLPVHPEFNQSLSSGLINIQEEKPEAGEALEALQQIWNKRIPGRPFDARGMVEHAKQLVDLIKASHTVLYAMERDCGLSLEEVARMWNQNAKAKGIVAPQITEEAEMAMAR